MAKFSWKRKIGDKVTKNAPVQSVFDDEDNFSTPVENVFQSSFKRRKTVLAENNILKSQEFKAEAIKLAENGRYFEAVVLWDKALQLTPSDAKILEMKAQALLQLNEPLSALQAARKAVMLEPQWWVAHQTLGRCQLGVGEIKMAIISFSRAIYINPAYPELWTDDLNWSVKLLQEQNRLLEEQVQETAAKADEASMMPKKSSSEETISE